MTTLVQASALMYWLAVSALCALLPPAYASLSGRVLARAGLFIILSLPVLLVAGMWELMGVLP